MPLHLKDGCHAVAVGDDLALLDIPGDAYLCVVGGGRGFRPEDRSVADNGAAAVALADADLLTTTASTGRGRPPPLPQHSLLHDHIRSRAASIDVFGLALATLAVRRARRRGGVAAYLALAPERRNPEVEVEAVLVAARVFRDLSPWAPIEGECLIRSALLVAFLRRRGLVADWVFGVRLWPFSAHCWVQCGDVCLNDDFERLRAYTPLFVA